MKTKTIGRTRSASPILLTLCLFAVVLLTGCATRIAPAGPDTYLATRSVSGFGTASAAKSEVYRAANAYCAKHGLVMVPVSSDSVNPQMGSHMGYAELLFRGLKPGDPEIQRANVESPTHTQRIQNR